MPTEYPNDIKSKVEYVKSQSQTRDHTCHWPGCNKQVPPAMWGCSKHWFTLPKNIRDGIWKTFKPGQEVNGTPSVAYIEIACKAQIWIESYLRNRR